MNGIHRLWQRLSFGRAGWNISGMPVIELTTTGRKSGVKRSTMLTSPVQVNDSYVVVASRGGSDEHPAWFLNLRDDARVEVVIEGGPRHDRLAHVANPEERAILWPQITAKYPNYAGYQKKTQREIPLVLLTPVP